MPRKSRSAPKAATTLADLTATEAGGLMRTGEVSAESYVAACLARIAEREPAVQAWQYLDKELALEQARSADELRRSGRGLGPLHGLPVGIKDIIDTADMPTENGSPIFAGRRPEKDASCVAQLRAAGAVIMGKTVTTELANRQPGKTRNPHNPAHTPGGSSSGSAAAVASGMVPLALATQTGGSVIRPASFCGIFALKPTFGLVSRTGVTMQSHTLDTVGVYARSIEDLALVADALSAHDPNDAASYVRGRASLGDAAREAPPLPPLLAFVKTPAWEEHAEPVMRGAFAELIAELGERVQQVELPAPFARICQWHTTVMDAEDAAWYGPLLDAAPERLSPLLRERLTMAQRITAREYLTALNMREPLYTMVERLLTEFTAILAPASPGPAPKGLASTGNPIFNGLWTFLGVPCVSVPLLEAKGLPLGVQLIGARRDDGRLLRTGRWLVERLRG
jgi:Asp-tRNA(Asn)/Glu-tRNA(Gln) amidotransferase A subunit family amidase